MKPKRHYPEQQLQKAVAGYLDVALPAGAVWSAIGHGDRGKQWRGGMWKGMGQKPGCPDIFICHHARTIFIEPKSEKGRLSPEQRAFHAALNRAGISAHTCRSLDDVIEVLMAHDVPLCATVAA